MFPEASSLLYIVNNENISHDNDETSGSDSSESD